MSENQTGGSVGTLESGIKLFREGNYQEALPILEAHAQEDALVCVMAAQAYKKLGDRSGCKRYLFNAADGLGSGDGALLLAQEYMEEENYTSALTWAERANKRHVPAAGQLLLRLSEKSGQWEKCLKLALEDLEWLEGYELFTFCEELQTLLDGGHYPDEMILELLGPVLSGVDDPAAKECLESAYQNAEKRIANAREREEKLREQADLTQQAQKNKEEARAAARERADQAVREARQAKVRAEKKSETKGALARSFRFLVTAALFLAMPILLNMLAHQYVVQGNGSVGSVLSIPFLGFLITWVCVIVMSRLVSGESEGSLGFTYISILQFSPLWGIGGLIWWGAVGMDKEFLLYAPYYMGIINCFLQEIRVLKKGGPDLN